MTTSLTPLSGDPGLALPSHLGAYRITGRLGQGGMAMVFEGIDESIGRRVAIKVLLPQHAADPVLATRFLNEARAVNIIEHPGIVQISSHGRTAEGTTFIVMELLRGQTLWARLQASGGRLSSLEVARLGWQIADVLAAAHACDIVHRDLKPNNVMLVPDPAAHGGERVKVLDFGIAKVRARDSTGQTDASAAALTELHALLGTPTYMSPEQCAGAGQVAALSDVYSLGVMLYELLCGQAPFQAPGVGVLLSMHMFQAPPPLSPRVPDADPQLVALIEQMLAKAPDRRPGTAQLRRELALLAAAPSLTGVAPRTPIGQRLPTLPAGTLTATSGQAQALAPAPRPAGLRPVLIAASSLCAVVVLLVGARGALRPRRAAPPTGASVPVAAPRAAAPRSPDQEVATAPAPRLRYVLRTTPSGAAVLDDKEQPLGETPLTQEGPARGAHTRLRVRMEGFLERELVLPLSGDVSFDLELRPAPRPAARSHPARPRSGPRKETPHEPDKIRVVD